MNQRLSLTSLGLFLFIAPALGLATLGGTVSSIQADQASMRAVLHPSLNTPNYSVHESVTPQGITVKEFASPDGIVFAVAWSGPNMPDLQQLLGQYFTAYTSAATAPHDGHRHLTVSQPDLVVHSAGRMRAFFGKAYIPSLLPAGVTPAQLQ